MKDFKTAGFAWTLSSKPTVGVVTPNSTFLGTASGFRNAKRLTATLNAMVTR